MDRTQVFLEELRHRKPSPSCLLRNGAGPLPIKSDTLDVIFCVWTLQYLIDDKELAETLSEFKRTLRPGGVVVMLEQFKVKKSEWQRTKRSYLDHFQQAGFDTVAAKPVRRGFTPMQLLIRFGILPRFLFPILVRWEISGSRFLPHLSFNRYLDCLFTIRSTGP